MDQVIHLLVCKPSCMNVTVAPEVRRKFARDHVRVNNDELFAEQWNQSASKCTLADSIWPRDDEYEWCLHEFLVRFSP